MPVELTERGPRVWHRIREKSQTRHPGPALAAWMAGGQPPTQPAPEESGWPGSKKQKLRTQFHRGPVGGALTGARGQESGSAEASCMWTALEVWEGMRSPGAVSRLGTRARAGFPF